MLVNEDAINSEVLPALQSISVGATNMGDLAKGLSITLIVFGSFILILSFLGACGACCELRLFLVIVSIGTIKNEITTITVSNKILG